MSHGITEISGESASGKTQLCLQLCLTVQLSQDSGGLDAGKSCVVRNAIKSHLYLQYWKT